MKFTIITLISTLCFASAIAQDTLVVPSMVDGEAYGIINNFIMGDTLNSGERANLDRVYKLNRGETYFLSGPIFADFPLRFTADPADETTKPAVITSGVGPNGQVAGADFFVCTDDVSMQNIYIMGTPPTNLGQINRVYHLQGDNSKIEFDNVIFEWGQWLCIMVDAEGTEANIQNCYFKNQNNTSDVWNGRAIDFRDNHVKKLVFINNTLFNVNSFMVRGEFTTMDEAIIEHNTVVNSLKWPIQWRWQHNVRIANNLFYNSHSYSETAADIANQDIDGLMFGIFNLEIIPPDIIDELLIEEADRVIDFKNNNWFYSQEVKDYWTEYGLADEPFMNTRTRSFFSDPSAYPHIVEENTYNLDPAFTNLAGSNDLLVTFMKKKRNGTGSLPWGFDADGIRHSITWPIVEDLSYVNESLLTGGDDGLPVGDLNWFPEQKRIWDERQDSLSSSVFYSADRDRHFSLSPNFPNPFSESTTLEYTLSRAADVMLAIYDHTGKRIALMVDERQAEGIHRLTWNAGEIPSGVYFYQLRSEGARAIGKMTVLD